MSLTRPRGEQLRFNSASTGSHVLDEYLEAAERGGRELSDLLADLFTSGGIVRQDIFEFRLNPATSAIEARAGDYVDPNANWTPITTIFRARGVFANATVYAQFDIFTYLNSTYIVTVAHTSSGSTPDPTKTAVIISGADLNTAVSAAAASASSASTSAGTATTQASTATTQAGIATTGANTATTQAGIAATQAGNAATSASTATTQASTATTAATTATTQAGIATTQADIATTKAAEAAASAAAAATFDPSSYYSKTASDARYHLLSTTNLSSERFTSTRSIAGLGGRIDFALPSSGSTLSTSVIQEINNNQLRIYEGGGTGRGINLDLTAAAASAASTLWHSTNLPASSVGMNLLNASSDAQARSIIGVTTPLRTPHNIVVNGSMRHSQRHGTTAVDTTTGKNYSIDGWMAHLSTTPGGTLRLQQVTSAGFDKCPSGSPNRLRATVNVADTTLAAGDLYTVQTRIPLENFDIASFGTGGFPATISLQFGLLCNFNGTISVYLINERATSQWSWVSSVSVLNGFQQIHSFTIPPQPFAAAPDANGWTLGFTLAAGSTFQNASAGWDFTGARKYALTTQTNFMASTSNTLELLDVGLYADYTPSGDIVPFYLPDYGEEERRVMREFEVYVGASIQAPANLNGFWPFKVRKRTTPTINFGAGSIVTGSGINLDGLIFIHTSVTSSMAAGTFADARLY